MSTAGEPRKMPVRPPVTNSDTKPMAKSIAGVKWIRARQSVATQLNVLTAEGMATLWRARIQDRKSTRLNSSHVAISYAVFCLKKKKQEHGHGPLPCRLPLGRV